MGPFLQAFRNYLSDGLETGSFKMGGYTAGRLFEFLKWASCPFFIYMDVMYAAGAWMHRSGDLHGCNLYRGYMDAHEWRFVINA